MLHISVVPNNTTSFKMPYVSPTPTLNLFYTVHGADTAIRLRPYGLDMDDAFALLQHLGYDCDVRITGLSMGGMITSALSLTRAELFRAYVVVDLHCFTLEAMLKQFVAAYETAGPMP
ncbi:hypothetical protein PSPO01_04723 [Paraphaeosphaeria sporulosa]